MEKSFSEKLTDILDSIEVFGEEDSEGNVGYCSVSEESKELAHKAIVTLIKSVIPAKQADSYAKGAWEPEYAQGINACREAILKHLETR